MMARRDPSQFKIKKNVPTRKAVIVNAAAAIQRGEYDDPTHAAHSFLNDYYCYDVWERDKGEADKYDRKVRYLAGLIKARIRSS